MAYLHSKNQKRPSNQRQGSNRNLSSFEHPPAAPHSQLKNSYLKAFKKYYVQQLVSSDKENESHKQKCWLNQRRQSQPQNQKMSTMTGSTNNSREKSADKATHSKIVDLVNNNDSHIQDILYNSISEVQRQIVSLGGQNDLAKENKLLKSCLAKLKHILKQKLQVALKKNKDQITLMFEQYSRMIKKLLEDKEALTNHLEAVKNNYANNQKRWQALQKSYENQIALIVKENNIQITNTKNQIEEFLEVINQYEEEAALQKTEIQNLRQKLVQLQMENDRLKKNRDQCEGQSQDSFSGNTDNYASKMKSLLVMLNEAESENSQLKQFLKNCKCSSIQSSQHSQLQRKVEQVIGKYERQMVEIQKQYLKEESMHRLALAKKDECIERLNLIIDQLRKQRYETVDQLTQSTLQARKELKERQ